MSGTLIRRSDLKKILVKSSMLTSLHSALQESNAGFFMIFSPFTSDSPPFKKGLLCSFG
ncbi:hypothetical protein QE357_004247 [Siphonobacter sp. BAB-5404]|nr:hypothetical protein [Siphonobacter sp. SORGH_AS_1065]MDR6197135.1 hypothetical protein [Siphonobacter sp. SORGH_AS_0500]